MSSPDKVSYKYSVFSHIGRSGEDRYVSTVLNKEIQMFAIFDGHGGSGVVDYLEKIFKSFLAEELSKVNISDPKEVREAVISTFIMLDLIMLTENLKGGSTAIVVLISGENLYLINLGDSRAVIFDSDKHILIETQDQTPCLEQKRIEEAGSYIYNGRVNGMLAISRAFGDFMLKQKDGRYSPLGPVLAIPEVTYFKITSNNFYVLLGSDGLFEFTTSSNLINSITSLENISETTEQLVSTATTRTNDDITAMIVYL